MAPRISGEAAEGPHLGSFGALKLPPGGDASTHPQPRWPWGSQTSLQEEMECQRGWQRHHACLCKPVPLPPKFISPEEGFLFHRRLTTVSEWGAPLMSQGSESSPLPTILQRKNQNQSHLPGSTAAGRMDHQV